MTASTTVRQIRTGVVLRALLAALALGSVGEPAQGKAKAKQRKAIATAPTTTALKATVRQIADQPDEIAGPMVKAVYVLASDGTDRGFDTNGRIAQALIDSQAWLVKATGGQQLALDTIGGRLDVGFVRLTKTEAALTAKGPFIREMLERGLRDAGFNDPNKLYIAIYDGPTEATCAGAPHPPELAGTTVGVFLKGEPPGWIPCAQNPFGMAAKDSTYFNMSIVHEVFHALGAAPSCTPHHTRAGHVSDDPSDLMYAGDSPWQTWNMRIDANHDDYFATGRTDCADIQHSKFLRPTIEPSVMPAGWGGPLASDNPQYA